MSRISSAVFLAAIALFAAEALAQAPGGDRRGPGGGSWGGFGGGPGGFGSGGFGGDRGEFMRRMDRNGNGQIEPDEVPDFMRGRFEANLREAGLDPRRPVSLDRLEEMRRQRESSGGGDGDRRRGDRDRDERRRDENRDGGGAAAGQAAAEARLVPGFGNEFEETPVPGFGETEGTDDWQKDYDRRVINDARETIQRYDTNRNGVLERAEWKSVQWRSDPNQSDRDKDGKLTL